LQPVAALDGDSIFGAIVFTARFLKRTAMVLLALAGTATSMAARADILIPQRGGRGQKEWDRREWTEHDKQEMLDRLGKMLSWGMNVPDPGPEIAFLHARASELLERTKQARANNFQFERLARATDALLGASQRIFVSRKASQIDENDKRNAAEFLQRCYFRVQQAEYFADLSGEKEAKQYVLYTRSLYQQARSAYDARQYDRAQMLGDASFMIVTALENIAQALLRIPDPPVIK
jgi:hypothetical protein